MVRRPAAALVLSVVFLAAPTARAGAPKELTPFLGFRFGGGVQSVASSESFDIDPGLDLGLVFDLALGPETTFEVVWSRQDTEVDADSSVVPGRLPLDITYLHLGATYSPLSSDGFVVMTAGATHFDPGGGGFDSETRFSVAAGGGVRKQFGERFGLRVEGRAYLTFAGGSTSVFCGGGGSGGSCLFSFDGDVVLQAEINVGMIVRF